MLMFETLLWDISTAILHIHLPNYLPYYLPKYLPKYLPNYLPN